MYTKLLACAKWNIVRVMTLTWDRPGLGFTPLCQLLALLSRGVTELGSVITNDRRGLLIIQTGITFPPASYHI